jgi:uncharacterized membrane protein YkvA (DUF1232 family)
MKWKEKAERLRDDIYVVWLAFGDRRTPWYAKMLVAVVVAYAVSPVDLIPDFIPVLGYIDDLVLVPVGVYLALKTIPREVVEECRRKARSSVIPGKYRWLVPTIIILIWLLVIYWIIRIILFSPTSAG